MKKAYITPAIHIVDVQGSEILALSYTNNGDNPIGQDKIDSGEFEVCTSKKGIWDTEWE